MRSWSYWHENETRTAPSAGACTGCCQQTCRRNSEKLQTNIDEELHRRFKTACFLQGREMKDVLTELIEGWLPENEAR
nr:plasmid partition protein ParG [Erwinia rhapontici]